VAAASAAAAVVVTKKDFNRLLFKEKSPAHGAGLFLCGASNKRGAKMLFFSLPG
jgi:hypothetical protein